MRFINFEEIFAQFIKEKIYLANISPRTAKTYKDALSSYKRLVGNVEPTKLILKDWVIKMVEAGLSAFTVNKTSGLSMRS